MTSPCRCATSLSLAKERDVLAKPKQGEVRLRCIQQDKGCSKAAITARFGLVKFFLIFTCFCAESETLCRKWSFWTIVSND